MIIIYSITNLINNKRYIGISQNYEDRKRVHLWALKNNKHKNEKLQNSVNKYGLDNFKFEILKKVETDNRIEALKIENYYIKKYDSYNNGYNKSLGFEGSTLLKISEETKEKHRMMMINNKIWLNRKHTEEAKIKIGNAHRGKKLSDKTKQKLSDAKKGKFKGKDNPFFNKKHTEETKEKLRKTNGNPIICIETDEEFQSINQCAKKMNLDRKAIERVLKGVYKQTKGYTFKYISH